MEYVFYWGARLREARKAAGLSQAELATMVGVSQSNISSWERGTTKPHLASREKLSKILDIHGEPVETLPGDDLWRRLLAYLTQMTAEEIVFMTRSAEVLISKRRLEDYGSL